MRIMWLWLRKQGTLNCLHLNFEKKKLAPVFFDYCLTLMNKFAYPWAKLIFFPTHFLLSSTDFLSGPTPFLLVAQLLGPPLGDTAV